MQEDDQISGQPEGDQLPAARHHPLAPLPDRSDRRLSLERTDSEKEEDKDEIDIRHYWQVLMKRKWTVLSTFGIVFLTTLVAVLLMTPIYRASTTIQIDRDTQQVMQVQGMNTDDQVAVNDEAYYKTQYQLLQSVALARRSQGNCTSPTTQPTSAFRTPLRSPSSLQL